MPQNIPVSYYRTTDSDVNNVPIVDGQIVVGTASTSASIYIDSGNSRLSVSGGGGSGGGHTMAPTPSASLTEDTIVNTVNAASVTNENVASLYGIQKWSNTVTRRFVYTGTVGSTGIGTWQASLNNPTAAQELGWGWWYNDYFKSAEINAANTDNIDIKIKYDPSSGEPIVLGGYILDTTNGYMCIKFANTVPHPANAKIAVDITIMRNQVS